MKIKFIVMTKIPPFILGKSFLLSLSILLLPPLQVVSQDGGVLSVGADIQFRIWNPVMSVLAVQDLNASTRMTAQNALTQSLAKKTVREIQAERVKLGEYLGVRFTHCWRSTDFIIINMRPVGVCTGGYQWADQTLGAGGGQSGAHTGFSAKSTQWRPLRSTHYASIRARFGWSCRSNAAVGHALPE